MSELMQTAAFVRKGMSTEEVAMRAEYVTAQAFQTERIILLSDADYTSFKRCGLMRDAMFLFDHKESMWLDTEKNCWHCLLVKGETSRDGLLVESEGYCYARYTAIVPDCDRLALKGVPVETQYIENAPTKPRKPRGGQER